MTALHVMASRKSGRGFGGISAQRNLRCSIEEAFATYANDTAYTRVVVVEVAVDGSLVVHRDQTFVDRIGGDQDEWARAHRLDDRTDPTVAYVLRVDPPPPPPPTPQEQWEAIADDLLHSHRHAEHVRRARAEYEAMDPAERAAHHDLIRHLQDALIARDVQ